MRAESRIHREGLDSHYEKRRKEKIGTERERDREEKNGSRIASVQSNDSCLESR